MQGKKKLFIEFYFLNKQENTLQKLKRKLKKKYPETNENKNMMIQNLWNTAKTILSGKFIGIKVYLRKQKKTSNNLTLHLKQLEEEEKSKTQS